jgi:hypothetical protein
MPGGMPGGPGGGGDSTKSDFRTPESAVNSFLNAIRAKDLDRLAEATALHAPTEAERGDYKKIFAAILDGSLAPEDMDELAKRFEGMQIAGRNQAKSSGRLGVTIAKSGQRGSYFNRTITVRREKAGWKVVDVSGQREFQAPAMPRGMPGTGGRRR